MRQNCKLHYVYIFYKVRTNRIYIGIIQCFVKYLFIYCMSLRPAENQIGRATESPTRFSAGRRGVQQNPVFYQTL